MFWQKLIYFYELKGKKNWGCKYLKNSLNDHEGLTVTGPAGQRLGIAALEGRMIIIVI